MSNLYDNVLSVLIPDASTDASSVHFFSSAESYEYLSFIFFIPILSAAFIEILISELNADDAG